MRRMHVAQAEDEDHKGIRLRFGGQADGNVCFENFLLVKSTGKGSKAETGDPNRSRWVADHA